MQRPSAARFTAFGGTTMKPVLLKSILVAACAITPLAAGIAAPAGAQSASPSVVRPVQDVTLSIGNGQLVTVAGAMTDVFVANESVADVQVKSARQLYIFGKGGGTTTVYASNAAGAVVWSGTVRVGSNLDSVDSMLRLAMPEAKIAVSTMGSSTFLLTGTVRNPEDAAEAERLVKAFSGKDANVISRLRMATPLQVNLQVRIAEVRRSLVKSLSVKLATLDSTGGFKFGVGQGGAIGTQFNTGRVLGVGTGATSQVGIDPLTGELASLPGSDVSATATGTTLGFAGKLLGLNLLGALDAGETIGLVSTLAQPNLTALSGETADFLAGGEYPIPISQGLGATSVEYRKYGVSLSYTPTVLANGRISMRVRPEVSELSTEGAVSLGGYTIPALTVRRTETTVELGSGQSFMIAGLLSNNTANSIQKMPGAGDLPILGSLFRSTGYRRGETELVIVVTPYLVNPVDGSQIALPTDGFNSPNELQRLLGNMGSDGVSGAKRSGPTQAPSSTVPSVGAAESKAPSRTTSGDTAKPGFSLK
ncbi:secretion system protein [Novosphingobium barchaimii LL02]|uniref:Secretion system protein n=1 Tax=Novosphingobium barchaimii LL02 TaxID=1114963 RepID=A0A0J8B1L6_9SPHN|nr:type II and III secretion system protein family protein [Novosphingobium barchaimii]KMS60275.1 secretion system protein [Novosphingobium barchaimii LL02]